MIILYVEINANKSAVKPNALCGTNGAHMNVWSWALHLCVPMLLFQYSVFDWMSTSDVDVRLMSGCRASSALLPSRQRDINWLSCVCLCVWQNFSNLLATKQIILIDLLLCMMCWFYFLFFFSEWAMSRESQILQVIKSNYRCLFFVASQTHAVSKMQARDRNALCHV